DAGHVADPRPRHGLPGDVLGVVEPTGQTFELAEVLRSDLLDRRSTLRQILRTLVRVVGPVEAAVGEQRVHGVLRENPPLCEESANVGLGELVRSDQGPLRERSWPRSALELV